MDEEGREALDRPALDGEVYLFVFEVVIKVIITGVEARGFDSRVGQLSHSVANGSPPLRRFFAAVLPSR